jgi:nitrile hydratase alpha subunit
MATTLMDSWQEIVSKAWEDEDFKQELLDNPSKVLGENGVTFPQGVNVTVVENDPNRIHRVLPQKGAEQTATGEGSDTLSEYNAACA